MIRNRRSIARLVGIAGAVVVMLTLSGAVLRSEFAPSTIIILAACTVLVGIGLRSTRTAAIRLIGSVLVVGGVVSLVVAVVLTAILMLSCCS